MSDESPSLLGTFHAWFDGLKEAVVLLSPGGTVFAANRSFSQLARRDDVAGQDFSEIVSAPPEVVGQYLKACSASSDPVEGSLLLTDADGNFVSCRCEGSAVRVPGSEEGGVLLRLFPVVAASRTRGSLVPLEESGPRGSHSLEARLRHVEARLALALEAGHMGIWEWDAESDELVWSRGLESIHGRSRETFAGTFDDHQRDIVSEDRDSVLGSLRTTIRHGGEYRAEYRVRWPDSSIHWVEDRGRLLYGDAGEIRGLVAVSIVIDQRRELEQQLRDRLERLAHAEGRIRSVVETVVDGIITIDERGIIEGANPAAEKIFGYAADEMIGKNVNLLMPDPYRSQHDRYLANYLQTGKAKIIGIGREVIGRRKDGSVFPMDLGVSEFRLDGGRHFTGIVRDITERKRAENTAHFLADASRSLATLVDYASTLQKVAYLAVPFFADWCTVHIAHEDGTLRQLAAAHIDPEKSEAAQSLGESYCLPPDGPIGPARVFSTGKSLLIDHVPDSLIAAVAQDERHRKLLRELGLKSYMGVPLAVRGDVFGVLSFYSADPNRSYDLADLAVAEDLAHRAAIAVENALLYRELREADRRKDEFLAMLAHELRNPLAPIRSGLDVMAMTGVESETVQVMQQQVEHLVHLVDDLLDVSRILRGKVELRRETIAIGTLVERSVDLVRPALGAAGQLLSVNLPPAPVYVHADALRLVQVFTNLLGNASKFTAPGGHIAVAVRQEGDAVLVSVKDNGTGISEEVLPHVFDLFTQADRSLERTEGGLGIGLTLVRTLVELHDGSVTAFSEGEGKGSEFQVRLPAVKHAEAKPPAAPAPKAARGRRILIVEDNVGTAKVLARLLAKLGSHDVRMVHDGLSALEIAAAYRPEIVLLDIGLPRMNGYDVAQRLRQQPDFRNTVLVALTGYGAEEDRRRSKEVGFDRHLVKPPSLENLREVLAHPRLAEV